jgi:hypothetical protein
LRTSPIDQTPAYDSSTWGYPKGYPKQAARWSDQFKRPDTDPNPDDVNKYSERARAVVALADGDFVVFGERLYTDDANNDYMRAMAQRYAKDGARDGALWTSPGLKVAHDAILAATVTRPASSPPGGAGTRRRTRCSRSASRNLMWAALWSAPSSKPRRRRPRPAASPRIGSTRR